LVFAVFIWLVATSVSAAERLRVAVLEFDAGQLGAEKAIDRTYFSDLIRGKIRKAAPALFVMTRESTLQILGASGKKAEDCEGECEVETGRLLGADYVVSGRMTKVGSRYLLTLRLHRTSDGELINTAEARGKSTDELVDNAGAAGEELVKPLAQTSAAPSDDGVQSAPQAKKPLSRPQQPPPPPADWLTARNMTRDQTLPGAACSGDVCSKLCLVLTPNKPNPRACEAACAGGDGESCDLLGLSYEVGYYGVREDKAMARAFFGLGATLLRSACQGGNPKACFKLGKHILQSHEANTQGQEAEALAVEAAKALQRGCDEGVADACTILGNLHNSGTGVPKSGRTARDLYEKACVLGDGSACVTLGGLWERGEDVSRDRDKARQYYELACKLGWRPAVPPPIGGPDPCDHARDLR
jgi:TolB-like protein